MPLLPLKGAQVWVNPENGAVVLKYGGYQCYFIDCREVKILGLLREDAEANEAKEQHGREQTSASRAVTAARAKSRAVGTD